MSAGRFNQRCATCNPRNGTARYRPTEETLRGLIAGRSAVDPTPTFYAGCSAHMRERGWTVGKAAKELAPGFDLAKNTSEYLVERARNGKIFVPCILESRFDPEIPYISFVSAFFRLCEATPDLLHEWGKILPASSGEGYVQPVTFKEVLREL
ncbi:hypothetical protein HN592_01545 [Candidatus Woesearchaeota archaeon]|jgi:hypothetical protein|nr:hypothetical protein [Candidatus Woesearchaeota archaeon]MBT4368629.1 hypothetical protein [Candidatus Woesearchaeota archaeon]MBT4713062.1 hypothetical protein [Candidatus Woesearchaeota archaeon]MBT6638984.1 hypothetical protein [Candidatus Woesearchaeota archaeon]MBT7134183.1 hypothetical protein [Candidatus Woesearchaeota archaeon]